MKKAIILALAALMFFGVTSQAFAAGGPPSDVKKGVFTGMDASTDTVVFVPEGGGEAMTSSWATRYCWKIYP